MSAGGIGSEIPVEVLRAAGKAHGLEGRVKPDAQRMPIVCDGRVVGFYTPHHAANGRARIGPFFVLPEYRRRGLLLAVYESMRGTPMMAAVRDDMPESTALHERAGFIRIRRFRWGWYWHRD